MDSLNDEKLKELWEREVRLVRAVSAHELRFGKSNADGYWYDTAACESCGFFFALGRDGEVETVESSRHCMPRLRPRATASLPTQIAG